MTKSELKTGYVVRCKDNIFRMVMQTDETYILAREPEYGHNLFLCLSDYNDDMTFKGDDIYTIMQVFGHNRNESHVFEMSNWNRTLLWERKEKKKYTYAQLREILGEEFEVIG